MIERAIDAKLYGKSGFGISPSCLAYANLLSKRFIIPPFSVWNRRDGFWQERRRRWKKLGIKSELGRNRHLTFNTDTLGDSSIGSETTTSVFDPVICELCYTWFCPPGGTVVDPFAGGSVRGIVASVLGYGYWGCDLNTEQIQANRSQLTESTIGSFPPTWVNGDSHKELDNAPASDFLFSCPPYGNLEVYSQDARDISSYGYGDFVQRYYQIIKQATIKLKDDRFACFVVGNYRDRKTGHLRNLVGDTIRIFEKCGLSFYNDIVLVDPIMSAAVRANPTFVRGRGKVVKAHQNVLVFANGQPKTDWIQVEGLEQQEEVS